MSLQNCKGTAQDAHGLFIAWYGIVVDSHAEILCAYPYLEEEDLREALSYAAWRVEEMEAPPGTA